MRVVSCMFSKHGLAKSGYGKNVGGGHDSAGRARRRFEVWLRVSKKPRAAFVFSRRALG